MTEQMPPLQSRMPAHHAHTRTFNTPEWCEMAASSYTGALLPVMRRPKGLQ